MEKGMTAPAGSGMVPHSLTEEQVDLIKRTVCKGSTNDELALFIYTAKRTGLDPLARQIHAVKRWDRAEGREVMSIQTGIDGYRLIAERTGKYAPGDIIVEMDKGMPISATACVMKMVGDTWHTVKATAYFVEYVQKKKDGTMTSMWAKMPRLMIMKCAEALALRRAFPAELSGLYTMEEMGQAENEGGMAAPVAKTTLAKGTGASDLQGAGLMPRKDAPMEAEVELGSPEGYVAGEYREEMPEPAAKPAGGKVISAPQGKRLYAIWKGAGKSDDEVKEYLKAKYGLSSTRDIMMGEQYDAICEWCADKATNGVAA